MKQLLAFLVAALVPCAAHAQFAVSLTTAGGVTTPAVTGLTAATDITADTPITVTCDAQTDCGKVAIVIGSTSLALSTGTTNASGVTTRHGTVEVAKVSISGTPLRINFDGTPLRVFQLINKRDPPGSTTGTPASVASLPSLCNLQVTGSYDQAADRAHFVLTTGGSILQYPDGEVDENDVVVVHVVSTDQPLLQNIEVARTSPTRTESFNIIGAGESFQLQSLTPCFERQFELGDFAPGEGAIEIYTSAGGQKRVLGTAKFKVNRLWHGIISFGPGWSQAVDHGFGLTPRGGKNVIVVTEDGDSHVLYAVQYTPFLRGPRDLNKEYSNKHHWNPTIGFAVNDFQDHALAGVSYDWKQVLLTVGIDYARVKRLAEGSGLRPGSEFTGEANTIPTEKKWKASVFVGFTVDARAARTLLNAILPAAGS